MHTRDQITAYRPPSIEASGSSEEPARSLLQIAWRRRFTVAAVVTLVVVAASIYLAVAPRIYTSRSRVYVPQNGPRLLSSMADPSAVQSDAFQFRQSEVIKADPVLRRALDAVESDAPQTLGAAADPMTELKKNLSVEVGKKDEIITIAFDSKFPAEAAAVVNAVVTAYRAYSSNENQSSAANMLRVLRGEKEKQEKTLDDKLAQIVAFKQKNGEMFFTTERGTNILVQNLATISDQLTRVKLNATSAYATFLQSNNKPLAYRQWQEIDRQAQEYERVFEAEKAKALKINDAQAVFQKLQLEADRTTKLCDLLDGRIKELGVMEEAGAINIQVLEVGKTEEKPTSPKKTIILLAAMALGLALGSAAALAHEALDQRVHTPDEAGRLLGLPVLGVIPAVRHAVASARKQLGRAVHLAPNSDVAEAYRTLRAAVYYGWPDRSVKSVLVTSPERGDGKSTTASNLAIAMAHAGMRTLLVDADLRAAVQHKLFDVPNTSGLSDVIARGIDLQHAVRPTEVPGLSLLPSGTPTPAPAEITNGQAFGKLLQQLEAAYDLIVIDSPPLLAVADARILGAQAGLTILTLRAEKSTRQDVKQACQQLLSVGSTVLGVVLNGVPLRGRAYAYGGSGDETPPRVESHLMPGRALPPGPESGAHALTY